MGEYVLSHTVFLTGDKLELIVGAQGEEHQRRDEIVDSEVVSATEQLKQEEAGDQEWTLGELAKGELWQCQTQQRRGRRWGEQQVRRGEM